MSTRKTEEKSWRSGPDRTGRGPSRRDILQAAGATAAVGVGVSTLSGSATADSCDEDVDDPEVLFCGCSQVCWCIPFCSVGVVHTEEEWFAFTDGNVALEPVGAPYETEYCYEVGDDIDEELAGEQILAFEVFNTDGNGDGSDSWKEVTIFENPNSCAQQERESIDIAGRIEKVSEDREIPVETTAGQQPREVPGRCGEPPCKHPGGENGDGETPQNNSTDGSQPARNNSTEKGPPARNNRDTAGPPARNNSPSRSIQEQIAELERMIQNLSTFFWPF